MCIQRWVNVHLRETAVHSIEGRPVTSIESGGPARKKELRVCSKTRLIFVQPDVPVGQVFERVDERLQKLFSVYCWSSWDKVGPLSKGYR